MMLGKKLKSLFKEVEKCFFCKKNIKKNKQMCKLHTIIFSNIISK